MVSPRKMTGDYPAGSGKALWAEPLGRSNAASREALRLILEGIRRLTRYRLCPAKAHARECRRLRIISDCLRDAALQLGVADRAFQEASALAGEAQDRRTRKRFADAVARRDSVVAGLETLGARAMEAASHFKEDLELAAAVMGAARVLADLRRLIEAFAAGPQRFFLRQRRHRTANALWMLRRRRSKCLRIADAPRRICRGRGPPFPFDLPALITASRKRKGKV